MFELVHAWAENPESNSGFETVYQTEGMNPATRRILEQYSGMHLLPNKTMPAALAHRIVLLEGVACSVLSRITQNDGPSADRPVRTAHHLVLTPSERPSGGPAGLLRSDWFCDDWSATSAYSGSSGPFSTALAEPEGLSVHPGWITLLARRVSNHTSTTIVLPTEESAADIIAAVEHSLGVEQRWEFTFRTGTLLRRDDVLLTIADPSLTPLPKLADRDDGVTLTLTTSTPDTTAPTQESASNRPKGDRVELLPATLQPANTSLSIPLVLLTLLALGAIALAFAALAGWL
ncbi:MAG: hypothetical protein HOL13_08240 [Phycisphaerae bacterium]|jgi:hypothetical protein|nr:hypothetical protein [Phycisphaerae bacterium]MBT5657655.1 hypothetical protein [Phycisphaerae bacterium]